MQDKFKSVWSEEELAAFRDILGRATASFKAYGVSYFPGYGTLLGHVRHEGRVIPWDDDADLIVVNAEGGQLAEAAAAAGLAVAYGNYAGYQFPKLYDPEISFGRPGLHWHWPFIDLFPAFVRGGELVVPCDDARIPLSAVFPLREEIFEGIPISVPADPRRATDAFFGDNWAEVVLSSHYDHKNERNIPGPLEKELFKNVM